MAKKRSRQKSSQNAEQDSLPIAVPNMEKMMADLHRAIDELGLESEEEINAFLETLTESEQVLSYEPDTPLQQAQEIMYQAWETRAPKKRIKLAKKALSVSEDCADAYVLLADESARNPEEALKLFQQAVDAGERAIGEDFNEMVGRFWGILETRPYMRARLGVANVLWALGERSKAIDHLQDMLRLNPNDNQGVRFILIDWLLDSGRDREAAALFKRYSGSYSAAWLYSEALLLFRKFGPGKRANVRLSEAIEFNAYVPPFLLMRRPLPAQVPDYYSLHEESEAISYMLGGHTVWSRTDGALMWLADQFDRTTLKKNQ